MDTTQKKTGTFFSFSQHEDIPQIPRVQDVLFALKLSERQEYYSSCARNSDFCYIQNVHIVVAAVGDRVNGLWSSSNEVEARRVVAQAIVDFCPEEARCLLRDAFVSAKRLAEGDLSALSTDESVLMDACTCPYHWETKRLRALSTD